MPSVDGVRERGRGCPLSNRCASSSHARSEREGTWLIRPTMEPPTHCDMPSAANFCSKRRLAAAAWAWCIAHTTSSWSARWRSRRCRHTWHAIRRSAPGFSAKRERRHRFRIRTSFPSTRPPSVTAWCTSRWDSSPGSRSRHGSASSMRWRCARWSRCCRSWLAHSGMRIRAAWCTAM